MRTTLAVVCAAAIFGLGTLTAFADDAKPKTVAALYKDKASLAGKLVRVQGKIVKVNNGIMGKNFLHVQDGTGDQGSNDLTVTSTQTANVGDQVTIAGRVVLNKDFGAGYAYPLLVEEATITAKK